MPFIKDKGNMRVPLNIHIFNFVVNIVASICMKLNKCMYFWLILVILNKSVAPPLK